MVGADIKEWQKQINYFQYGLEVDGYYGEASKRACEDLQQKRGLTVDGVIGPETWRESFERD
jgi:peptidoglycan hydrolase-like protein with peptidoglycan-binding domain